VQGNRLETLLGMVAARPDDARARFGLAIEYERNENWEGAIAQLTEYLRLADDEGNAFGRLARALSKVGRAEEARDAYHRGIATAERHGHPTLAMDLQDELDDL